MPEDHLERKTYRKSPGRQYGYEYDPLKSRSERSQTGSTASRSGMLLSHRPDPRRTRQLLRQSIIASKRLDDEMLEDVQPDALKSTMGVGRSRSTRRFHHSPSEPYLPSTRELMRENEDEFVQEEWSRQGQERYVDPDLLQYPEMAREERRPSYRDKSNRVIPEGTRDFALDVDEDEDLDDLEQQGYYDAYPSTPQARGERLDAPQRSARASDQLRPRRATTRHLPEDLLEEDVDGGYIYDEDEELPPGLHIVKKERPSSRRNFLIGAGVLVAGGVGVGVVASQSGHKAPLIAPITNPNNTQNQVKNAYNQGLSQGADQARRELIAALDDIETYTLQGAIDAALLTRQAYDVFVSPVIKFGAALTGDFLSGMLGAFKVARNWLAGINQDNATLAAIQKVLESWVNQAQSLPKQLDAITQTDLDGAQGYLRALQRKIEAEKKALNSTTSTPTSSPTPKKS